MSAVSERHLKKGALFLSLAQAKLQTNLEPIVDARSGKMIACEALMRGERAIGLASPHEALEHADQLGVLTDLEIILAKKAIQTVVELPAPRPRLFLNIDSRILHDWKTYRDSLLFHVQEANIAPAEICLEISEARQALQGESLGTAIDGLRGCGFRIAIDDFGAGSCAAMMLYHARPDFLKIDRPFVQAMPNDPRKRLLVQAIARLAHTMGARVIAEGVETEDELQACRQTECSLIQGYLVKSPDNAFSDIRVSYALPGACDSSAAIETRLANLMRTPPTLNTEANLGQLFELSELGDREEILPVVDCTGMLTGGIYWHKLQSLLSARYGAQLARMFSSQFGLKDHIEQVPTIDIRQPLSTALDMVADKARYGVLVVDGGTYLGLLSPYDLMRLASSIALNEAQRRNPLSGLPGNEAISELVQDYGTQLDRSRLIAYIDISDFKPFNDTFGFELGDRAILLLVDLLKKIGDITGAFVGHIGGDDFFLAADGDRIPTVASMLTHLPKDFADASLGLLPEEARSCGFYLGRARDGELREIPFIGVTVACLEFRAGEHCPSPEEVAAELANRKTQSRVQPS